MKKMNENEPKNSTRRKPSSPFSLLKVLWVIARTISRIIFTRLESAFSCLYFYVVAGVLVVGVSFLMFTTTMMCMNEFQSRERRKRLVRKRDRRQDEHRTRIDAPLIPLVALVEFPPKKALLSNNTTEPPFSKTVCAADKPAKPPPMTITLFCCWDILYVITVVYDDDDEWDRVRVQSVKETWNLQKKTTAFWSKISSSVLLLLCEVNPEFFTHTKTKKNFPLLSLFLPLLFFWRKKCFCVPR